MNMMLLNNLNPVTTPLFRTALKLLFQFSVITQTGAVLALREVPTPTLLLYKVL